MMINIYIYKYIYIYVLPGVQNWLSQRQMATLTKSQILRFYAEDWGQLQEEDASILGAHL